MLSFILFSIVCCVNFCLFVMATLGSFAIYQSITMASLGLFAYFTSLMVASLGSFAVFYSLQSRLRQLVFVCDDQFRIVHSISVYYDVQLRLICSL